MEGQKIIHDCNQKNGPSLTIQTMHSRNMQMRLNTFKTSLSTCLSDPSLRYKQFIHAIPYSINAGMAPANTVIYMIFIIQ